MYGQFLYGTFGYGEEADAPTPPEDAEVDLMKYLPPYWHAIREMIQLQQVNDKEINELKQALNDVFKQFFIDTATWGLELWERELGLQTDPSRPYERRREQIKAKLRGSGTTTVFLIKSVAEAFSGGEVEVIEKPGEYHFQIKFIGVKGIPPNMTGLAQAIDDIKPAHLTYDWEFTWTWWAYLTDQEVTWNKAGEGSWNDLKTYDDGKE